MSHSFPPPGHPPADGCLIDLDGTVYESDRPIAGAAEALELLRRREVPYRFVTNTTRMPRATIVERLLALGIEARPEDCLTAPVAAAAWLELQGARRISLLLNPATYEEFDRFELDDERPDHVLVGDLGAAWSLEILDRAFRALMAGAELVAIQRNRYWLRDDRLSLDAGPFVAALEYATGKQARLIGKPSAAFFLTGAEALAVPAERVVMVGDDLESDVLGAKNAGLLGALVRTGKFRPEEEPRARAEADAVLDSLADLPAWLGIET